MEKGADICLVVEGSYPYVTGGVSSWIQWLMENATDFTFAIVALIAEKKGRDDMKYTLPGNVVSYDEYVIFDYEDIRRAKPVRLSTRKWKSLSDSLFRLMIDWRDGSISHGDLLFLKELITEHSPHIFNNFLNDEHAFLLLTNIYEEFRGSKGFIKYFYNYRNIHLIVFRLLSIIAGLPEASVYHSPGTGYGGFIACLKSAMEEKRSMITEHGIYLQEREMELLKSQWLDDPYLKDMWIEFFTAICLWQYTICDRVITLYEGNRNLQVEYGADRRAIAVVPNGIKVDRFKKARRRRCTGTPRVVALVGRVDSVKDIKTFIQAMAIIKKDYGAVQGYVIGPADEQPGYYKECEDLTKMLELEEVVTFTGRADVLDYYWQMDVLLLTSIKEAMPLVVMEAMACGIPVVATDVGACRELIHGHLDDIGPAGTVERVMDPKGIADATLRILKDEELANRLAVNGIRRIETFYREELVIQRYRELYRGLIDGGD